VRGWGEGVRVSEPVCKDGLDPAGTPVARGLLQPRIETQGGAGQVQFVAGALSGDEEPARTFRRHPVTSAREGGGPGAGVTGLSEFDVALRFQAAVLASRVAGFPEMPQRHGVVQGLRWFCRRCEPSTEQQRRCPEPGEKRGLYGHWFCFLSSSLKNRIIKSKRSPTGLKAKLNPCDILW